MTGNSRMCSIIYCFLISEFILSDITSGLGLNKYKGYKVLRLYPHKNHHVDAVKRLENKKPTELEIVKEPADVGDPLDLLASPAVLEDFLSLCQMLEIPMETVIPDLPSAIVDQLSVNMDYLGSGEPFTLDRYHPYHNINNWLYDMQHQYPNLVKIFSIGYSWEMRPMNVAQISRASDSVEKKPAIWLDAGIHANEWIGPATLLYFINELVTKADTDPEIGELLDNFVFYILPVFNVDGYVYSWTTDRMWRKSRSTHKSGGDCVGVDMNRNWDFMWQFQKKKNTRPCSRVYAGPYPFSEPENLNVKTFLGQHNASIVAYLAYHSYSQYWMTPYGFSAKQSPPDKDKLHDMGTKAAEALAKVHGTKYKVGSIAELVGETSGSSVDYVYGHLNIKYSFGIELRDKGVFGTLLPPDQIIPNAEESFAAMKTVGQMILQNMAQQQGNVKPKSFNDIEQEGRPF